MIFKRFFKPKWQHPDAAVRQLAITELNTDEQAHKTVLHELAFNDGAEAVRKAALLKLNDFALWWQASKQDSAERLQQLAEQTLIKQLLHNQVEPKLKQQFIAQCNRSSILEQLAQTETDAGIKFSLLQRLNKAELNVKALQDPVLQPAQKQQLLAQIEDEKLLEKLAKQLDGELLVSLQHKLTQLQEEKQKPQLLRKQLTLLLAKLNAARERVDLAELPAQLAEYQTQWQQLEAELPCLGNEAAEFRAKYDKIVAQLNQWLAPRLAELSQQQAEQAAAAAKAAAQQALQQRIDTLEQALQQALLATDISAAQQLEQQLSGLATELAAAEVTNKTALHNRITQLQQQLTQLPELAEQLAALTRIVADWASQPLPDTAEAFAAVAEQLQQWQQQWRQLSKAMIIAVPASLLQAKNALAQQWQQAEKAFSQQAEKTQRQCRSKLAQYRRLYSAGKYKVLFGLFKGIEQDYQQLTAVQQAQLSKDYDFARDKMAELADWQEYIATPRKQQLLQQMQQLSSELTENQMRQRADEVKQARAQWNSFGKADPALEAELNAAFDQACEQAFAPCRAYFAAQDALRAEHVLQRQQIINRAQQFALSQPDAKALDAGLQQLKQAWQQAGAVDKQQFAALNEQFNQALMPLREQLSALQQQAAAAKQQLIEQAKAAVNLAEPNQTAKVLKECQQQWKSTGNAARKQDQALWQQFRAVCDGFFNARSEQFEQQKHAEQAQLKQLEAELAALTAAVDAADAPDALAQLQQQLQAFPADSGAAQQAVRRLQDKLTQKQQQWQQQQQQREFALMFDLLAANDVSAEQLAAGYREYFNKQQEQQFSRAQLTLALELIADMPSPPGEQSARQQVQLLLLSDKHNQGSALDKHSLLKRWLQFGPVTEAELPLLARVKLLFS
ncbi:DUF349 domain-containing protein [Rheinheimera sp.]|uniref:DUF349 domain-containing protein n=1 Tax=Rheinheimera sp. TaxID=1869214 RepID=UPI002735A7B7|nr:DUF349 domain-containing protein [Rheinheimera sp.]MDP2713407.1 DUF349 domain-containing protein [Rheinheimera sp.]